MIFCGTKTVPLSLGYNQVKSSFYDECLLQSEYLFISNPKHGVTYYQKVISNFLREYLNGLYLTTFLLITKIWIRYKYFAFNRLGSDM